MSQLPKRRLLDKLGGSPTVLGESTHFIGNLVSVGPFVLFGKLRGDGRIDGPLHVASTAHWEGDIEATQAIIAGHITGSLAIAGKLEIGKSAVIHGSVTAQTIAIAQGAVVDGDIRVTGQTPIVRFEEKRGD